MSMQAQDLKILVNKKGKVGFADQNGKEVIKCQFESAQPFKDGAAVVTKSGKYGIINATGKIILPLKYTQITSWNDNLYVIKDGKKIGLSDHWGKIVLPAKYSQISKPNCYNRALIAVGGKSTSESKGTYMANAKYGIIDNRGKILVTPKYKGLYEYSFDGTGKKPFHEGKRLSYSDHYIKDTLKTDCSYLGFSNNNKSVYYAGVMDGNGKELIKAGIYYFVMEPHSDMARYYNVKKKKTLCGYHDINTGKGFQTTEFESSIDNIDYWTHGDFIGDIAPVNGASWSFIDKKGKPLRSDYTDVKHSMTTGLWAAKKESGKWDVFNNANNDIESLSGFEAINFPAEEGDKEIFSVKKDGKYGCIDRTGKVVIPFEYEEALSNTYDVIMVKKNGKWGALTTDNTLLIKPEYNSITFPVKRNAQHYWVKKSDNLYYHYNLSTKSVAKTGYKSIYNYIGELAYVVPQDLKVEDTQLNRAQLFIPYTSKATLDAFDMSKAPDYFVYIVNAKDEVVFDLPVSTLYKDTIRKEIEKRGNRPLTTTEKRSLLLEVTKGNRSYDLKSTLGEEEWNY